MSLSWSEIESTLCALLSTLSDDTAANRLICVMHDAPRPYVPPTTRGIIYLDRGFSAEVMSEPLDEYIDAREFTVDTGADLLTCSDYHGFAAGDIVTFEGGDLPEPLEEDTEYFVLADGLTTTALQVSATEDDPVNLTDAGSGSRVVRGVGWVHEHVRSWRHLTYRILVEALEQGANSQQAWLENIRTRMARTSAREVLHRASLGFIEMLPSVLVNTTIDGRKVSAAYSELRLNTIDVERDPLRAVDIRRVVFDGDFDPPGTGPEEILDVEIGLQIEAAP